MKEVFKETVINIRVKAKIHLVAAISPRESQEDYISEVSDWVSEVVKLAKFARKRGTVMLCCFHLSSVDLPPQNQDLLKPLENAISLLLIVAITERNCNQPD